MVGDDEPEIIREGLLFQDAYLYFFFFGAVTTAFLGLRLLKVTAPRAVLTAERVEWEPVQPQRRHVVGSVVFGIGWGVSAACPGPIATQLGQGIVWGVPTTAGLVLGIILFRGMQERTHRDPGRARAASLIPSPAAGDASG